MEVLFEVTEFGEELTRGQVWESIEAIVSLRQLREAVDAVSDMVPPGADAAAEMRARLTERIATVTPFLKILTEVITFGCTPEGEAALAAMRALPRLLDRRTRVTAADIDHALLSGSWKFSGDAEDGRDRRQRVRVLRPDGLSPVPEAPGDLRRGLVPVA